ncbi:MAG: Obg family GTPase CgtA [Spirochaetales bacterium]
MQSFVDEVTITLQSGHGGKGAVSFRREKYVPKGGPDGGDGGHGGNVVLRRRDNLKTLSHLLGKVTLSAKRGGAGSYRNRHGADGADLVLEIPPGTVVYDADTGELLADLAEQEECVLLHGGIGGKGNARFATSTNQAPRYAQDGMPGKSVRARIELKLVADIGLVGLPNAGKSSLLSAMSNARPKVGDYPFTTKIPNLGVFRRGSHDVIIADIPGIIEGAAEGHGLGLRFLKHISRTARLLYVVDLCGTPESDVRVLESEIASYESHIADKPRIIVGNKIDIAPPETSDALRRAFPQDEVHIVSVATRRGLGDLGDTLVRSVHGDRNE